MGEVYRAKDLRLDREVALKLLPERFARSPEWLARFEREAKALAALSHPNVLGIHDVGAHESTPFVVVELLSGETLRERIARSPLPWREAVEISLGVAEGLTAAHAKGIVHRDLKPANVFLTEDGRVKVIDFGLACSGAGEGWESTQSDTGPFLPGVTQTGVVLGTAPYLAPEQARGERADARSDLFSVGCVLYEMLAGKRAFGRTSRAETIAAILHEEPPALANPDQEMPRELNQLIRRCLEKDPEKRLQAARDLAFALRSILADPTGAKGPPGTMAATPKPADDRPPSGGLGVMIPAGGIMPRVIMNDLTQLMTKEDAALVRRHLPWYRRGGPGLLPTGVCCGLVGFAAGRLLGGTLAVEMLLAFVGLLLGAAVPYTMTISGVFDKQALRAAERAVLSARKAAARKQTPTDSRTDGQGETG